MNTAVINIKTDPKVKAKAQKKAAKMGISLSHVINNSLRNFIEMPNYKETPYGIFKGMSITEKEIDEITHSWNKVIDEIG
jgi:antitoxin component of RelBE/YafQ-DinJ toxin-antitoxin module